MIDIGGVSTEVIVGRGGGPDAIQFRHSLDIGSVRLTERFFDAQPPSARAVQRAIVSIDTAVEALQGPDAAEALLIGTSGTTEALALVHAGPSSTLDALDGEARWLSADAVHHWRAHLLRSSIDDVRALHPDAMRGRADVFPMGVLILDRFLQATGHSACRVSAYQLRHGLVLRWLHQQQGGA